jgi:hypothetical protein
MGVTSRRREDAWWSCAKEDGLQVGLQHLRTRDGTRAAHDEGEHFNFKLLNDLDLESWHM